MVNLNVYVEKVWAETTLEGKLAAFTELVNVSHAKKEKKALILRQAENCSIQKLDSLAVNYSMAGSGLKVF
jgi:hypothetical protein